MIIILVDAPAPPPPTLAALPPVEQFPAGAVSASTGGAPSAKEEEDIRTVSPEALKAEETGEGTPVADEAVSPRQIQGNLQPAELVPVNVGPSRDHEAEETKGRKRDGNIDMFGESPTSNVTAKT